MDGQEAFEKVKESMQEQKIFSLIFMDIQVFSPPDHNFRDSGSQLMF